MRAPPARKGEATRALGSRKALSTGLTSPRSRRWRHSIRLKRVVARRWEGWRRQVKTRRRSCRSWDRWCLAGPAPTRLARRNPGCVVRARGIRRRRSRVRTRCPGAECPPDIALLDCIRRPGTWLRSRRRGGHLGLFVSMMTKGVDALPRSVPCWGREAPSKSRETTCPEGWGQTRRRACRAHGTGRCGSPFPRRNPRASRSVPFVEAVGAGDISCIRSVVSCSFLVSTRRSSASLPRRSQPGG